MGDPGLPTALRLVLLSAVSLRLDLATGSRPVAPHVGSVRLSLPASSSSEVEGEWEVALAAGAALRVPCEGRRPLRWWAVGAQAGAAAARLAKAATDPSGGAAVLALAPGQLSGDHAGQYCCSRDPPPPPPDGHAPAALAPSDDLRKCFFLFVDDPAVPIVELSPQLSVSAVQGQRVTLPCRPSSRGVALQLLQVGVPRPEKGWAFDPRLGFSRAAAATGARTYKCVNDTGAGRRAATQRFHLVVHGAASFVERPHAEAPLLLRAGAGAAGAALVVNCSVVVARDMNANFSFHLQGGLYSPDAPALQELHAVWAGAGSGGNRSSKRHWQAAAFRGVGAGVGDACCDAEDNVGNRNTSCARVAVVAATAPTPQLRLALDTQPPAAGAALVTVPRGASVQWRVRVGWEGAQRPVAAWTDPDGARRPVPSALPPAPSPPAVEVAWQPPPDRVPAPAPGVARAAAVVFKLSSRWAEPGNYSLEVSLGKSQREVVRLELVVRGPPQPRLLNDTLAAGAGAGAGLVAACVARAEPPPSRVTWWWLRCNGTGGGCGADGVGAVEAVEAEGVRAATLTGRGTLMATLTIKDPLAALAAAPNSTPGGRWLRCSATNALGGGHSRPVRVHLAAGAGAVGARGPAPGLVGGVVGVLALIIGAAATCVYITLRQKRARRRLHCAGLRELVAGEPGALDPSLPADVQAELLPYEARWEFPRENLVLSRQKLGAGAFGVVVKAEARFPSAADDPPPPASPPTTPLASTTTTTTVAVKMVKRGADDCYLRALASELKILAHLGRHLNVVNLLGACTDRILDRELLVLVEYCPYGNLHNYLLRRRELFVDQVDPATGRVDPARGAAQLAANQVAARRARLLFQRSSSSADCSAADAAGAGQQDSGSLTAVTYCPAGEGCGSGGGSGGYDSAGASVPLSPLPDESSSSSGGGPQPLWRTVYRCDQRAPSRALCTCELLSWAYQVACGMKYLAQRKVLHGDLAARNVLLARDGIVKICDFGLARSMFRSDTYKKKGDGPLPIKWMALESIRDRIFSTQSDVWSFGVVMWEFFSLGATPYPGLQPSEEFYNKLQSGYRMERPQYSPTAVYDLMCKCWLTDPRQRPTFESLVLDLGVLLETSTRERLERLVAYELQRGAVGGECDYLAMLGSPDYGALTSPDEHVYVNTPANTGIKPMAPEPIAITNPDPEPSDYLNMSRPSTPGVSPVSFL